VPRRSQRRFSNLFTTTGMNRRIQIKQSTSKCPSKSMCNLMQYACMDQYHWCPAYHSLSSRQSQNALHRILLLCLQQSSIPTLSTNSSNHSIQPRLSTLNGCFLAGVCKFIICSTGWAHKHPRPKWPSALGPIRHSCHASMCPRPLSHHK
jgi:hypothetical protein